MSEKATEKSLTPGQRKAIETLLTEGDTSKAAEAAGCHRSTLYKWMKQPLFASELREAEAAAVQALSRNLASLGASASKALMDALDENQKITVRLRAAEIVIGNLLKIRELVEIETRLSELEARLTNGRQL